MYHPVLYRGWTGKERSHQQSKQAHRRISPFAAETLACNKRFFNEWLLRRTVETGELAKPRQLR